MSQINVTAIMSRLEKTYLCAPALIDESFPMNLWRFGLLLIIVWSIKQSPRSEQKELQVTGAQLSPTRTHFTPKKANFSLLLVRE